MADKPEGKRGVASDDLRRHNLSAVLERLHLAGELSRSRLAQQTGLNRSTIRDLLGELTRTGLVVEDRRAPSTTGPGRPSAVARPHAPGAVVLAVDLEVDSTAVATVGLGGHIFDKVRTPNSSGPPEPRQVVKQVADLSSPLLDALPHEYVLGGVGVAVAGVVRRRDGFVHLAPNLRWKDVPLADMISSELGAHRVRMGNEADLGALAEYLRGKTTERERHLIMVAGEVGVGIGVIYDGKPMLGASGYAGEAGHTMINPEGRRCRCGAVGCWETEVGEEALARLAGISSSDDITEEVLRRAHDGDQQVFAALHELGRWLGLGIGNLINTFNPDVVVIGRFFERLYPFLERSVKAAAQEVALDALWRTCSIRPSDLGSDSSLIGASELVFSEVIANPTGFTTTEDPPSDAVAAPRRRQF